MKALVFIDHDIIIRHFLHSNAFDELIAKHEVVFVFPELGNKRITISYDAEKYKPIHINAPAQRLRIWKSLFYASKFRFSFRKRNSMAQKFYRSMGNTNARIFFSIVALPGIYSFYKFIQGYRLRKIPNRQLIELFDQYDPDVVIHPSVLSGLFIDDVIDEARKKNIPSIIIMNSWDNPSTKAAMSGNPDWLIVWGEQTKNHAIEYMGMKSSRVVCFGAAQFDVYSQDVRISRSSYLESHKIPTNNNVLLYAGSSKGVDEFGHLMLLEEAIESGRLVGISVIYRPHPWGRGGVDGHKIIDMQWKHIKLENSMISYLLALKKGDPGITAPDYKNTHDLLSAVDMVISPLSTILLEAAIHGKLPICLLTKQERASIDLMELNLGLDHFKEFLLCKNFNVIKGHKNLISEIKSILDNRDRSEEVDTIKDSTKYFISQFDETYSIRLNKFIESALNNHLQ